jgi:hypothetical protein
MDLRAEISRHVALWRALIARAFADMGGIAGWRQPLDFKIHALF